MNRMMVGFCLLLALSGCRWLGISQEKALQWRYEVEDGMATIVGLSVKEGMTPSRIVVPATVGANSVPVRAVEVPRNEWYIQSLREVVFDEGIQDVADGMFAYNESVEKVIFPASLKRVPTKFAFLAKGLRTVAFATDSTADEIGDYAFYCSGVREVDIPKSVRRIGRGAFSHCASLGKISLNEGLEIVDDYALDGDCGVTTLTVPHSVKTLGAYAFFIKGCEINLLVKPPKMGRNCFDEDAKIKYLAVK